jgi:hypothetical protein
MSTKGFWLIDALYFCRFTRGSRKQSIPVFVIANHIERHFSKSTNEKTQVNTGK